MYLTEKHVISKKYYKDIYEHIDNICYKAKNLYNYTNYQITQAFKIHSKLYKGEAITVEEQNTLNNINDAIRAYNATRPDKTPMKEVDKDTGYIDNSYFLMWWLRTQTDFTAIGNSRIAEKVIGLVTQNWSAYKAGYKAFKKGNANMTGMPRTPKYYDKTNGRCPIVVDRLADKVNADGTVRFPALIGELPVAFEHKEITYARIHTKRDAIVVEGCYQIADSTESYDETRAFGIDIGVNNFATIVSNTDMTPIIMNGRVIKSINIGYVQEKTRLQTIAQKYNGQHTTKRLDRLWQKRSNKIKDSLHKITHEIIERAIANNIGLIVVGDNKHKIETVQTGDFFEEYAALSPFGQFMQLLTYKAQMHNIKVETVDESYTSGTSYLDNEAPTKDNYNIDRRITRGQFEAKDGSIINADVNAAYQILKKSKSKLNIPIKQREKVVRLNIV